MKIKASRNPSDRRREDEPPQNMASSYEPISSEKRGGKRLSKKERIKGISS